MKNFSGVCQAAGADKPLRAFFIWITNIVTLSVKSKALITTNDRVCCGASYSCAVVRGQGGFALSLHRPCQGDSNHYLRFKGRGYIPISNQILQCKDVPFS